MGLSNKTQKTDTTSTAQNTATTTPNVPDWIQQPAVNMAGGINSLIGQGAGAYTPQTTALQNQTWQTAAGLQPAQGSDWSAAQGAIGNVAPVQGQSVLTGLDQYMTPYANDVVNPVLADYDVNAGKTRAAQAAAAAGNQAFQGSRYGVQEAATEGDLARGRATTQSGLLDKLYTQAAGMSDADAARRQAAMEGNQQAQLGQAGLQQSLATAQGNQNLALSADQRANLATQAGLGQQQYEQQTAQQQYPLEYQKTLEGLLQGLNPAMFTGNTATGSSSGTGTSNTTANQSLGSWFGDFLTATAASAAKGASAAAAG